jgi:hypothetical protein
MSNSRRACWTVLTVLALAAVAGGAAHAQRDADKKPSLSFKATPPLGFSPLRVQAVVDLKGGANDHADFYCPSIEWDWGDDVVSEKSEDCDPYEPGKSTIARRYSATHVFRLSGNFRVTFRLKQKDRVIATSGGNVQVRPGVREDFGN